MGYNYNYYYYHSSIPYQPKVGEEAGSVKSDWPLAAMLAAHELKNAARRRLKIPIQESGVSSI